MKKILISLVAILGIYLGISSAQDALEFVCTDGDHDYYEFNSDEPEYYTVVPQDDAMFYAETKQFTVKTDADTMGIGVWRGLQWGWVEDGNSECAEAYEPYVPPPPPLNECLGMTAGTGEFVVDNMTYPFSGTLSFLVPEDMYWSWDLYIDGVLVLTFEQTEDNPCRVVAWYESS